MGVLLAINSAAVSTLGGSGIGTQEMVCALLARELGKRDELQGSPGRFRLSDVARVWCITTPIYTAQDGSIQVRSEEVDEDTRRREGLTLVGRIDPDLYAGALCAKFGLA